MIRKILTITLFLLTALYTNTISAQSSEEIKPFISTNDSVTIRGKIIGFNASESNNFIAVITHDLYGEDFNKSFLINSDGSFEARVYQPFRGDIMINYKNAFVKVLTPLSNRITLDIRTDGKAEPIIKDVSVKGNMALVNNTFIKFQKELLSQGFNKMSVLGDPSKSDSTYAIERMQQLSYELKFFKEFINKEKITDKTFIAWQTNDLKYTAGHEIIFSLLLGKPSKTRTTDRLLNYIKSIPIENTTALGNGSYYRFLNTLSAGIQIIININPIYESIKKAEGNNSLVIYLNESDKYASGISRELIYLHNYPSYIVFAASANLLWPRFNSVIENKFLNKKLQIKRNDLTSKFKPYSVFNAIAKEKIPEKLKDKIATYFKSYLGKHLYIDFWGDWCQPCLMEMPTYPPMISALKGENIQFVFFSVMTSEQSMNAIKAKFGINAIFINLDKDEEAVMRNVFSFQGYPTHFVLDKKGNVITNHIAGGDATSKAENIIQSINNSK